MTVGKVKKANLEHVIGVHKMDYHHLESFASETFDEAFTMETFVHATDPAHVLREFFRVLKPGGRVVLDEYEHSNIEGGSAKFVRDFRLINKYGAIPTNELSEKGCSKT